MNTTATDTEDLTLTLGSQEAYNVQVKAGWIGGRLQAQWWNGAAWEERLHEPGLPTLRLVAGQPVHPIMQRIPVDLRTMLQPVRHAQFLLLQMGLAGPELAELLHSNLKLAWLMAACAQRTEKMDWKTMIQLARLPRPRILGEVGLTATPSALKLLGKIQLRQFSKEELGQVRRLLAEPSKIVALRHLPVIPVRTLELLEKWPLFLETKFLPELTSMYQEDLKNFLPSFVANRFTEHETLLRGALRMGEHLGIPDSRSLVYGCTSFGQLRRMHDRWSDRMPRLVLPLAEDGHPIPAFLLNEAQRMFATSGNKEFPPPPFPGNEHILPIRTLQELIEEGNEQRHCVGSYATSIMAGESYIYKVLQPQRGTLEIRLGLGGEARIAQFRLVRNTRPAEDSIKAVQAWFAEHVKIESSKD